jgi:ferrochelatase
MANSVALRLGLSEGVDSSFAMLKGIETFGSADAPRAWYLAYQSKGNKPGAWLGPDLEDLIDALAGTQVKGIVVVPIGFMTDHMETLYDLDIVTAEKAYDAGLEFVRAVVPNAHPDLLGAVARSVAALA